MAAEFARERVAQIFIDANYKPLTVVQITFLLLF